MQIYFPSLIELFIQAWRLYCGAFSQIWRSALAFILPVLMLVWLTPFIPLLQLFCFFLPFVFVWYTGRVISLFHTQNHRPSELSIYKPVPLARLINQWIQLPLATLGLIAISSTCFFFIYALIEPPATGEPSAPLLLFLLALIAVLLLLCSQVWWMCTPYLIVNHDYKALTALAKAKWLTKGHMPTLLIRILPVSFISFVLHSANFSVATRELTPTLLFFFTYLCWIPLNLGFFHVLFEHLSQKQATSGESFNSQKRFVIALEGLGVIAVVAVLLNQPLLYILFGTTRL